MITETFDNGMTATYGKNGTERTHTMPCPSCGESIIVWMLPDADEPIDIWNAICPACHRLVVVTLYHEPTRDDFCSPLGVADPPPPPDYCEEEESK